MDAVTMPNPIAGTRVLTVASPAWRAGRGPSPSRRRWWSRSPAERCDLRRRHRSDDHRVALQVLRGLERPGRVVPLVEHDGPARADVLDLLARLQRGLPGGERGDHRL